MNHVQNLQRKFNPILPDVSILSLLKLSENVSGFLMFLEGISLEYWKETLPKNEVFY